MAITYSGGHRTSSAKLKVLLASLVGILAALLISGHSFSWQVGPLLGWDTAAVIFSVWTWATVWPMSGHLTAGHALREDPSRSISNIAVLLASFASLVAIGAVLVDASSAQGSTKLLLIAFGVISVVVGWITVHTIFALRYAESYYQGTTGGVDFPNTSEPCYKDFAYLAFTIGMTFQVSDTGFQTTDFRRLALRHSLISYLFGTVIVATTINLIAGLTK